MAEPRNTFKSLFPGYFKPTDAEIRVAWKEGTFVFDASALLNVYRYSPESAKEFLSIIEKLGGRVWLPFFAAQEYVENRLGVVKDQEKTYQNMMEDLGEAMATLVAPRAHPFISDSVLKDTNETFSKLDKELKERLQEYKKLRGQDAHQDEIIRLFDGRIASQPDAKKLATWTEDAKGRHESKRPPGFKDAHKGPPRAYHDVYIWLDMIELATTLRKPVIFITDDQKEDWWRQSDGMNLGPHELLVEEMQKTAGVQFFMYTPTGFLERAATELKQKVSKEVIEEAKASSASLAAGRHGRRGSAPAWLPPLIEPPDKATAADWVKAMAGSNQLPRVLNLVLAVQQSFPTSDVDHAAERATHMAAALKPLDGWKSRYWSAAGWFLFLSPLQQLTVVIEHKHSSIEWIKTWRQLDRASRREIREYIRKRLET